MEQFELIVPTLFGNEAFAVRELKRLGYDDIHTEDGSNTLPMVGGAAVGILSVAALAALFVYLKKRSR